MRTATAASTRAARTTRVVYRCRRTGRGHVARAAEPVDAYVGDVVVERLSRPDVRELLVVRDETQDKEQLRTEAVALRLRLGEAADSFADGAITAVQLEKITARVRQRLDEVESAMIDASRGQIFADLVGVADVTEVWNRLGLDRKRAVIAELMTVVILPTGRSGNVFDPETVAIRWKTA